MFAGKTETLISYARRYTQAKKKIVLVKYSKDTRYDNRNICSHNRTKLEITFSASTVREILDTQEVKEADVVMFDEIQFFADASEEIPLLAQEKIVICAGLNSDYRRRPFPNIAPLLAQAEQLTFLAAVCSICGEDAHFTRRIVASDSLELIGGAEAYQPRCRSCFDQ